LTGNVKVTGGAATGGNSVQLVYDANYAQVHLKGSTGGFITFSDSSTDFKGRIIYTNSNNSMKLFTNATEALEIDSSQNATFAGTITSSNLATKNVVLVHGAGGVVGNSGSNSSDSHTWTITHGMGSSRNYKVEVMLNSGNYDTVYPDITRPSDTTIVITFSAAVANSAYKALILKCE